MRFMIGILSKLVGNVVSTVVGTQVPPITRGFVRGVFSGWIVLVCATIPLPEARAQSIVTVEHIDGQFTLKRNGAEYPIRGVGGQTNLELLARLGGNSIRTWDSKSLDRLLPLAQQANISVCVGLWLGHQRHGFDYQDQTAVLQQLEQSLETVRKYKDHPAVLMWGIGNEMEGDGRNPAVWYAVDHIAREIKQLDPHHPTMTVIAEIEPNKVQSIGRFCPHVDIIGINSYGGASTLDERYRQAGGNKPYVVTEFGPLGPWEVAKTRWGAPLEPSSTEKAKQYVSAYESCAGRFDQRDKRVCLGAYAFLWGHKQETTATWFGMFLDDGSRTQAVDEMSRLWSDQPPDNRCPEIVSLEMSQVDSLKPQQPISAQLRAQDPERDPLAVRWIVRRDDVVVGVGGDAQKQQAALDATIDSASLGQGHWKATLQAPDRGGAYRLFVIVSDGKNGAAVANVPFFVDAPGN